MFRSGGYAINDELEDATFAFGRTAEEVKRHPKARIPTGLINLIRRCNLMEEVLETGFFLEISCVRGGSSFDIILMCFDL